MNRLTKAFAVTSAAALVCALSQPATTVAAPRQSDPAQIRAAVKGPALKAHLAAFQKIADRYGSRAAGTQGYVASARYVEYKLREAGYNPTRQWFDFEAYHVDTAEASEVTPTARDLEALVMEYSESTPEGGVTADVVAPDGLACDAGTWDGVDVEGKIALVSRGECAFAVKAQTAGEAGAAAVIIYNNTDGALNGTLGGTVEGSAPAVGVEQAVGQSIAGEIADGEAVTATVNIQATVEQTRTFNIVANTNTGDKNNTVMLGAHLDGVEDGPGINDNGSGSAAILETAIQLKKFNKKLKNNVRFAWWGAEENGLLGSTYYVNNLVENNPTALDKISTYLNFDMVASPNWIIGVYDADESSSEASAPVPAGSIETEKFLRTYFRNQKQPAVDTEFSGRSDYQAFIENGVASGGLFTGADGTKTPRQQQLFGGTAGVIYDPNYHTAKDDLSNAKMKPMNIMSDAIATAALRLGMSTGPIDVPRRKANRSYKVVKPAPAHGAVRR